MTEAGSVAGLRLRTLDDFEAPALSARRWDALLAEGPTDVVFLTHEWQRLWWNARGDETLLIVLAESDGEPAALAPMFAVEGSVSFVGSGGSDYLDFIGNLDEPLLAAMLRAACDGAPGFSAVELYHVPLESPTAALLPRVAARLGLELHQEEAPGAPYADLGDGEILERLTARRSVRKEEARMRRQDELRMRDAGGEELDALIDLFFVQHAERWRVAGQESFDRQGARDFVRAVVHEGVRGGWVRLTVLEWRGSVAAIDISLIRGRTQLTWLVSRDSAIQEYSPGRVLRAHVIREAYAAGIRRFDFGLGEEDYKLRDASGSRKLGNWFLYP